MDVGLEDLKKDLEPRWGDFGIRKNPETSKMVFEMMSRKGFGQTSDDGSTKEQNKKP